MVEAGFAQVTTSGEEAVSQVYSPSHSLSVAVALMPFLRQDHLRKRLQVAVSYAPNSVLRRPNSLDATWREIN
jgi:hypothetical protein